MATRATPHQEQPMPKKKSSLKYVSREGTVDRLPSGRWRARLPHRLGRRALDRTFPSEITAWEALAEAIDALDHPQPPPPPDPTLGEVLAVFIEAPHLSVSTRKTYKSALHRVPPALQAVRVSALTRDQLARWAHGLVAKGGFSPATADQARRLVAAALNYHQPGSGQIALSSAVWGRGSQAATAATAPRDHPVLPWQVLRAMSEWEPPSTSVWRGVEGKADPRVDASWRLLIEVIIWGGLREGEALGLTTTAIDAERPVLTVTQAAIARTREVGPTKTSSSTRQVSVPVGVWRALQEHAATLPAGMLLFSGYRMRPEDRQAIKQGHRKPRRGRTPVAPDGRPLAGSAALKRWQRIRSQIDAPADATIHSLRATAASVLLDAGASILEVAAWLGHATPETTLKHYAKAAPWGEAAPWVALRGEVLSFAARLDRVHRIVTGAAQAVDETDPDAITIQVPPGMTPDDVLGSMGGWPEQIILMDEDGSPLGIAPAPDTIRFGVPDPHVTGSIGHVWVTRPETG
jgi:integrase